MCAAVAVRHQEPDMSHKSYDLRHAPFAALAVLLIALSACGPLTPASSTASNTPVAASTALVASAAPSVNAASPTASALPTGAAPSSAPSQLDPAYAVQTLVNYYRAISDRAYDQAYALWANDGAASNQTFDQFKQGFASTAGLSLRFGSIQTTGDQVVVPVTLTSITNDPTNPQNPQSVQHFEGTYTLAPASNANGWQLASAAIKQTSSSDPQAEVIADPLKLLQAYYDALNNGEYARAYTYWTGIGRASRQDFVQFEQGFATTARVAIELGAPNGQGAAGSAYADVPIVIVATQRDQTQQTYCGTYTLRRSNVPPFDQFGWQIETAKIAAIDAVQPGSDQAQQLLSNGCRQ